MNILYSMEFLSAQVEKTASLKIGTIRKRKRNKKISLARMAFSYIAHELGYPFTHIGKFLGKDHSTIMYHCEQVELMLAQDHKEIQTLKPTILRLINH